MAIRNWQRGTELWTVGRRTARGLHGYSLIELLVGLVILAMLGRTSVPIASRVIQAYQLRGAALEVLAQMQQARMAAVAQGTRYRLQLSDAGKLVVSRYNAATSAWVLEGSVPPLPTKGPNVIVTASAEIIFAPNGTAPSAGTVTLTNPAGKQRQIVVSLGGSVRLQ